MPPSQTDALPLALICPPPRSCLQRQPGRWVVHAPSDPSTATDAPPAIIIPSIEEVFPLEKCLLVGARLVWQWLGVVGGWGAILQAFQCHPTTS